MHSPKIGFLEMTRPHYDVVIIEDSFETLAFVFRAIWKLLEKNLILLKIHTFKKEKTAIVLTGLSLTSFTRLVFKWILVFPKLDLP
jgi:predicted rRNA methylase YqxC with S4 and FtsJ domains